MSQTKNDELSAFSLPKQICAQATPFPGRYEDWATPTRTAMQADSQKEHSHMVINGHADNDK